MSTIIATTDECSIGVLFPLEKKRGVELQQLGREPVSTSKEAQQLGALFGQIGDAFVESGQILASSNPSHRQMYERGGGFVQDYRTQ